MKIALIGYGKMGKMIEQIAIGRGHEICLKISSSNLDELTVDNLKKADAIIEFSVPSAALHNIKLCIESKIPSVIGTTGWNEQLDEIKSLTLKNDASLLYGSNFSVGVNIFFALNKKLAGMMNQFTKDYAVSMTEVHHIHKLDAPSGTAITLAEDVIHEIATLDKWSNSLNEDILHNKEGALNINSIRENEVPGTHIIKYDSEIDSIEIKHEAKNRKGFALGSIIAAEWLANKKGFYNIKEMFNF